MRRFLYTALLVISIPSAEARLSNVSYDLPLTSFTFSPGSPSHYSSPYIHFLGNDGAQYSQRVERGGCYSIVVSAGIGLKSIAPAPRASARARSDPGSGSDYDWNAIGQHSMADYVARISTSIPATTPRASGAWNARWQAPPQALVASPLL